MLGKLIKHEWKSTWKTILLINLFLIILTILGCIAFASKFWAIENVFIQITGFSMLVLYYITIIGMTFAVLIYLYVHFFKNLYSSEGYLMHTLPVTPRQLICSKLFLGTCYILLTFCNIFISVGLLLFSFVTAFGVSVDMTFKDFMDALQTQLPTFITSELGINFPIFILLLIATAILSAMSSVLMGFASISLGQLYAKHKVLGSFIAYFAIQMGLQFLSTFLFLPLFSTSFYNPFADFPFYFRSMLLLSCASLTIFCIILYVITELVMHKQLNLD